MGNKNKTWVIAICIAVVALVFIGSTMFEHGHLKKSMYEKCLTKGYGCLDCDLDCVRYELKEINRKFDADKRFLDEWQREVDARAEIRDAAKNGKKK